MTIKFSPLHDRIQATGINKIRGQTYGRAVKAVWAIASSALQNRALEIKAEHGKFTSVDLAIVSLEFGLSFKVSTEFLEELDVLPSGTYDRLKNSRGFRVKTFLDAAKERAELKA